MGTILLFLEYNLYNIFTCRFLLQEGQKVEGFIFFAEEYLSCRYDLDLFISSLKVERCRVSHRYANGHNDPFKSKTLRTGRDLLPTNIIFLLLLLISVRG
jgi:hypothetical protein